MILPLVLFFLLSQLFSCFAVCNKTSLTKLKKFKTKTTKTKVNVTIPLACGFDETMLDVASLCVFPVVTTGTTNGTTKTRLLKKKSKKKVLKGKSKKVKKTKKRVKIKTKKNN